VPYLSEDEEWKLRKVLLAKYSVHLPEFELAHQTGIRQSAQYNLTWEMIDWQARMLHIPQTKNEEPLHIPLNDTALAALRVVLSRVVGNGRVFVSARTGLPLEHPGHWFDTPLVEANILGFHWHDLRPTFARRLRMKGTPLVDIADLLGHKGLAMTRRYAHLGTGRLHEVVARLVEEPIKSGTKSGTSVKKPANQFEVGYLN
jgi:integrase